MKSYRKFRKEMEESLFSKIKGRLKRPASDPMTSKGADDILDNPEDIDPDTVPEFEPEWKKYKSNTKILNDEHNN